MVSFVTVLGFVDSNKHTDYPLNVWLRHNEKNELNCQLVFPSPVFREFQGVHSSASERNSGG